MDWLDKIAKIFVVLFIILMFCFAYYFDTQHLAKPDNYKQVYINCGHAMIFECYISNEDYDKWLQGNVGVITVKPYGIGDTERNINLSTIINIQLQNENKENKIKENENGKN